MHTEKDLDKLLAEALVPEEEQPYEVTENWVWVRLGSVVAPMKSRNPEELGTEFFTYIDIESIDNINQKIKSPKILHVFNAPSRARRAIDQGDVIISMVRPYLKNIALVDMKCENTIASTGFFVLSGANLYNSEYLFNYLVTDTLTRYLISKTKGDNSPSVRKEDILNISFPIPPVFEQKRIVERLDCLLGKISETKQLIEEAKETFAERRTAILAKAFRGELTQKWREEHRDIESAEKLLERIKSEKEKSTSKVRKKNEELPTIDPPYELPQGWCWVRLKDIFKITSGGTPSRFNKDYFSGNIPWIKTGEINWNYINSLLLQKIAVIVQIQGML